MHNVHDVFIEYYEKYKNKLFTYLMYRLNFNRELSEDLLMDIVLKAYESFDLYNKEKGTFKNWIFAIAHNHLINFWRDRGNKNFADIEPLKSNEKFIVNESIPDKIDRKIETERIKKTFTLMDKKNSELLILKYIHEFENNEIAQMLRKKEGAVRTAVTRAMKQFKQFYTKLYYN